MKNILKFVSIIFFACITNTAFADTYTFTQPFSGTWSAIFGDTNTTFLHSTLPFQSTSDPLNPLLQSLYINNELGVAVIPNNNITTCISCTGTDILSNGDKFFTTFTLDTGAITTSSTNELLLDNIYSGTFTVTGGTGLFQGATGGGHFDATDFGVAFLKTNTLGVIEFGGFNSQGNFNLNSTFTVNTAPVPEPETYALLMVGLSVMGLISKNSKGNKWGQA